MNYFDFCELVENKRSAYALGSISEAEFSSFLRRNGWDDWFVKQEVQSIDDRARRHPLANRVYS